MAAAYEGEIRTCSFASGTLTAANANSGLVVTINGAQSVGGTGLGSIIPQVVLTSAGSTIYGVLLDVDTDTLTCSVQIDGIAQVSTGAAPDPNNFGQGVLGGALGVIALAAGEGRGQVFNHTASGVPAATDMYWWDMSGGQYFHS